MLGNESCDLDSAVSAIALAYFYAQSSSSVEIVRSRSDRYRILPMLNIPRKFLPTKTEVTFFLQQSHIDLENVVCRWEIEIEMKFNLILINIPRFQRRDFRSPVRSGPVHPRRPSCIASGIVLHPDHRSPADRSVCPISTLRRHQHPAGRFLHHSDCGFGSPAKPHTILDQSRTPPPVSLSGHRSGFGEFLRRSRQSQSARLFGQRTHRPIAEHFPERDSANVWRIGGGQSGYRTTGFAANPVQGHEAGGEQANR